MRYTAWWLHTWQDSVSTIPSTLLCHTLASVSPSSSPVGRGVQLVSSSLSGDALFLRVMHNTPSYAVRTYPSYIIKCRIVFISTIYINMFNCIDVKTILIIKVSIALITEPEHIIVFKFISRELIPTFFTGHLKEASTDSFWSVLICFTDEAKTTRHQQATVATFSVQELQYFPKFSTFCLVHPIPAYHNTHPAFHHRQQEYD